MRSVTDGSDPASKVAKSCSISLGPLGQPCRRGCGGIPARGRPRGRDLGGQGRYRAIPAAAGFDPKRCLQLRQSDRPEGRPDDVKQRQEQDAHAALLHFDEHRTWGVNNEVVATTRSTWLAQANWDGSVAASLMLSDGDVAQAPSPGEMIAALWRVIVPLCSRLGGYGSSQLSVVIAVTKTSQSIVTGQIAHSPGRPPPDDSLYSKLGEATQADRAVDLADPDNEVVVSLDREIRRAAGEIQDEDRGGYLDTADDTR